MHTDELALAERIAKVVPFLDERQRRLYLAAEANSIGYGGMKMVARLAGASPDTIRKGMDELLAPQAVAERVRRPGAGRKKKRDEVPGLRDALLGLVESGSRGDPMSPLRWTTKSTRRLSAALKELGYEVSHDVVAQMLNEMGFSLQANVKTQEGKQHVDRDAQFIYIDGQVQEHMAAKQPVISVDTKKKELVGNYKNGGREWRPVGKPRHTKVHDFEDEELGKAAPYGIYDPARNTGWVNVGTDHDTSAFAVESIRRWWYGDGMKCYKKAKRLLICADGGGSNGYRIRLWKVELAKLADETGLSITVCHLPPGTSKWNKIEHRLFSHITMNWRGQPLVSHDVIVNLIGATTTRTGLTVKATLDTGKYPKGIKVSDDELASIPWEPHPFHGEWNYTITPAKKRQRN